MGVPDKNWSSVSLSASGQYQTAGISATTDEPQSFAYLSSDYGKTWKQSTSSPYISWSSISLSSSGQYQLGCCSGSGQSRNGLYKSSDYGYTWVKTNAPSDSCSFASLSSSGQFQTACFSYTSLYTSNIILPSISSNIQTATLSSNILTIPFQTIPISYYSITLATGQTINSISLEQGFNPGFQSIVVINGTASNTSISNAITSGNIHSNLTSPLLLGSTGPDGYNYATMNILCDSTNGYVNVIGYK